jgi:hypothetical protein
LETELKIRPLPAIDLANIAALPRPDRLPALRAFKAGSPRFSYRLVRLAAPDIFNAQSDLLGTIPPTDFEKIRHRIEANGTTPDEIKANIEVAESLHAYAIDKLVRAKKHYIAPFQLSGAVGIEVSYWLDLVLSLDGRLIIPFLDPRRSHALTSEGRRFAFSMIQEKARTIDPDLADAELAIFQFTAIGDGRRLLKVHVAGTMTLMTYDELDMRVSETYADWELVQAERAEERRRAGGSGSLL